MMDRRPAPAHAPASSSKPSSASFAEEQSRRMWRLTGMGWTLASEILAGAALGWFCDWLFGTKPTLLIICTVAGVLIGMITFIRAATRANKDAVADAPKFHRRDLSEDDTEDRESPDDIPPPPKQR